MTVPPFLWVRIMNDADLKAENGRLRERIDALEQQLRDATTSSADWDAELQRENARLMAENATLKQQANSAAAESASAWDAELQRENARLMAENATLGRMSDEVLWELEQCRHSLTLKSAWERAK